MSKSQIVLNKRKSPRRGTESRFNEVTNKIKLRLKDNLKYLAEEYFEIEKTHRFSEGLPSFIPVTQKKKGPNFQPVAADKFWDFVNRLEAQICESEDLSSLYNNLIFAFAGYSAKTDRYGNGPVSHNLFTQSFISQELLITYKDLLEDLFSLDYQILWKPLLEVLGEDEWFKFLNKFLIKQNIQRRPFEIFWTIYKEIRKDIKLSSEDEREEELNNPNIDKDEFAIAPLKKVLSRSDYQSVPKNIIAEKLLLICINHRIKPRINTTKFGLGVFFIDINLKEGLEIGLDSDVDQMIDSSFLCADSDHNIVNQSFKIKVSKPNVFILLVRALYDSTNFFATENRIEIKLWLEFLFREHPGFSYKNVETYFDNSYLRDRNLDKECKNIADEIKDCLPDGVVETLKKQSEIIRCDHGNPMKILLG